jgi:hypothetical protein
MKSKAETRTYLRNFITYVKNQFSISFETIRSDNGLEFCMDDFYAANGILHQKTCVESPKQNYVVERKHRHILKVTGSILFHP